MKENDFCTKCKPTILTILLAIIPIQQFATYLNP